jgi:hypothetical protein
VNLLVAQVPVQPRGLHCEGKLPQRVAVDGQRRVARDVESLGGEVIGEFVGARGSYRLATRVVQNRLAEMLCSPVDAVALDCQRIEVQSRQRACAVAQGQRGTLQQQLQLLQFGREICNGAQEGVLTTQKFHAPKQREAEKHEQA